MAWLFERTVEAAAWVAMILAWCALALGVYWFVMSFSEPGALDANLMRADAIQAGLTFVGLAVALGILACVDRFLFDADDA